MLACLEFECCLWTSWWHSAYQLHCWHIPRRSSLENLFVHLRVIMPKWVFIVSVFLLFLSTILLLILAAIAQRASQWSLGVVYIKGSFPLLWQGGHLWYESVY